MFILLESLNNTAGECFSKPAQYMAAWVHLCSKMVGRDKSKENFLSFIKLNIFSSNPLYFVYNV
jgi:hypothetical protein